MIDRYIEPNSPMLSELYCSDEDYYQYLEDLKSGKIKKPEEPKQPENPVVPENPYLLPPSLSELYCSDEDYYDKLGR